MGRWVVPYRQVVGEKYPIPLVDFFLLGPAGRVPMKAMVDSGAFRPIFSQKMAELAGIDLSKSWSEPIQYGGSKTVGKIARVRIDLGSDDLILETSIVFVEKLEFNYALLGRIGFFDRFNEVAFIHKNLPQRVEFRW